MKEGGQKINAAAQLKRAKDSRSRAKRRHEARRRVRPGFPREHPFESKEEVEEYLAGDTITCLRCGKEYRKLAAHLEAIHGWTAEGYREHYRIPFTAGLVSAASSEAYAEAALRRGNDADYMREMREQMPADWSPSPRNSRFKATLGSEHKRRKETTCDVCGDTFVPARSPQTFCGKSCAVKYQTGRKYDPRPCATCGTSFRPGRSDAKYCGPNCRQAAVRERKRRRRGV
jgi:hypothetical protein